MSKHANTPDTGSSQPKADSRLTLRPESAGEGKVNGVRDSNPHTASAQAIAIELRSVARKLKRQLREQTDLGDVTWSQVPALVYLEASGPATITTLARIEGMRSQSMGAIISGLSEIGFVAGTPDPKDGRQTLWSVTPACRAWFEAGRAAREDWLSHRVQKELNPQEQAALLSALGLIHRVLDQ
jgi:DNA-binding MarR family transcriptional regulator